MDEKNAKFIQHFKTIKPKDFLHQLEKSNAENIKIINGLQKYGIPDEVINVLISYLDIASLNKKFNDNFAITIATSLVMEKISTAEEAMDFVIQYRKVNSDIRKIMR